MIKKSLHLKIIVLALFFTHPVSSGSKELANDTVIVLGLDSANKTIIKKISRRTLRKSLAAAFSSVQDSLYPALATLNRKVPAHPYQQWEVRTIAVGVGMSGEFGLGPLGSITVSPKVRLVFTNSKNPAYPD